MSQYFQRQKTSRAPDPHGSGSKSLSDQVPQTQSSTTSITYSGFMTVVEKDITGPPAEPVEMGRRSQQVLNPPFQSHPAVPVHSIHQELSDFLTDTRQQGIGGKTPSRLRTNSITADVSALLSVFSLGSTSRDPSVKPRTFTDDTMVIGLIWDGEEPLTTLPASFSSLLFSIISLLLVGKQRTKQFMFL